MLLERHNNMYIPTKRKKAVFSFCSDVYAGFFYVIKLVNVVLLTLFLLIPITFQLVELELNNLE